MNEALEHILMADNASDADIRRIGDACDTDSSVAQELRVFVLILEYLRDTRIRSATDDFNELWDENFSELTRSRITMHPVLRWIAAATIITGLALFAYIAQQGPEQPTLAARAQPDQFLVYQLPDGSSIRLSPGSSISVVGYHPETSFTGETRDGMVIATAGATEYILDGSAFFSIVPRTDPLTIKTELATTSIVGTQFGIIENEQMSEIVLMEGRVSFAANERPDNPVILDRNESSRVIGRDLPTTPAPVDIQAALAWTDLILFRNAPLQEIAATLSSRFNARIEVDPALDALTFTNTFRPEQGLEEMMKTIAMALAVKLESDPEHRSYRLVQNL